VLEKQEEGQNTYRVTDWEPYEGSLVAVPADPTVGVGRDDDPDDDAPNPTNKPEVNIMSDEEKKASEKAAAEKAATEAQNREMARVNALLAAGDTFPHNDGPALARELMKDPNGSVDQFNARMLEKMRGAQKPTATAQPHESPTPYGQGARQVILRGGTLRAFKQPLRFTDGTSMDALECAYRSGMWLMGSVYGNEKAKRWCAERGIDTEQRVMQTGVGTLGGVLVPVEMEQSIIDLRESYGLARRLARRRPMMSDTKSVTRRTGGITAYFINEDNSGVTASDKGWDNINLVAKTLAALALISKNLEEDAMIDVVDDLAVELAYAFAKKEDQCWLIGDGTSTYGGMQGLLTKFNATDYASRLNAASGHDTMPEYDASDLAGVRALVADLPMIQGASWITSKAFCEAVFNRLKATAGGNTAQTRLPGGPQYDYLGDPAYTSEIFASDPTADQSDTTVALYGDYTNSSSFGDRRGIIVEVLRERYAEKLQIGVLGHERFEIVNHDLGSTTVKGPVGALYAD
jgi:HK97 family phage major capsid protein